MKKSDPALQPSGIFLDGRELNEGEFIDACCAWPCWRHANIGRTAHDPLQAKLIRDLCPGLAKYNNSQLADLIRAIACTART